MENNRNTNNERARCALFSLSSDVSRDEWIQLGMAAHAAGLQLEDFLQWSSTSPKFVDREARVAWRSFKNGKGVGAGTLFRKAKEAGWSPDHIASDARLMIIKPATDKNSLCSAAQIWEQCVPLDESDSHPYVERKHGIKKGLRVVPENYQLFNAGVRVAGALVVPICPLGTDEPTSLQFIADGDLAKEWNAKSRPSKLNLQGAAIDGVFTVGEISESRTVYVTEGVGQAWTCWKATRQAAVVSFGWGRVRKVIQDLKTMYKDLHIVIVPDAGLEQEAAELSKKYQVSFIQMPDGWTRNSDVNDLERRFGIEAVEELLAKSKIEASDSNEYPLDIIFGDEISRSFVPPDELVEGLLVQGELAMIFGDSNSGKTFLMIDMAAAISRGTEWLGRKTERGVVVYLATESPASVRMRLQGYQIHNDVDLSNFAIVTTPVNLFDSDVDTNKIIQTIKKIESSRGEKVRLIVGDTLARLSAGANENSGEDMGLVLRRVERLQRQCESTVVLIHHVGKNVALGARGWSGVRAAIDTELEVIVESTARCLEVKKQRDLGTKGTRIGFDLMSINLGKSKWGAPVSTCVVSSAKVPEYTPGRRVGEIACAIIEFLTSKSEGIKKSDLVKYFEMKYDSSAVYREVKKLVTSGRLSESAGVLILVKPSVNHVRNFSFH